MAESLTEKVAVATTVEKRQIMPAVTVIIPMPQGAAVPAQSAQQTAADNGQNAVTAVPAQAAQQQPTQTKRK